MILDLVAMIETYPLIVLIFNLMISVALLKTANESIDFVAMTLLYRGVAGLDGFPVWLRTKWGLNIWLRSLVKYQAAYAAISSLSLIWEELRFMLLLSSAMCVLGVLLTLIEVTYTYAHVKVNSTD